MSPYLESHAWMTSNFVYYNLFSLYQVIDNSCKYKEHVNIFFCSNPKSKVTWSAIIVPWLFMVIFVVKETTSRSCWSFSCSFPLFSYVWSPHQFYYSNVVLCTRTKLLLHSFSLALAEISLRAPWVWSALSSVVQCLLT